MKKNKIRMKKWERVFLLVNIGIILIIAGIYSFRLVSFYIKENTISRDTKLVDVILKNVVYNGSGLYKNMNNDKEYYYKGKNVNNYLMYSGRLFRIIGVDDNGIKLITEDNQTILVWGKSNKYATSYINNWLNKTKDNNSGIFLKSLDNYENLLIKDNYCIDTVSIEKQTCKDKINDYIGLLTVEEYIKAGGTDSYLNNNTYYWTINASNDDKVWYVFDDGGISNESFKEDVYYSYGVRPVINLNNSIKYYFGDGTIDNPYIIEENNSVNIKDKNIGEYVVYNDYSWQIQEKNDQCIRLIMDGYIKDYATSYNNIDNYLNNDFYKSFNASDLVKCDFYKGNYNNYDYRNTYSNKETNYVGLPSIGELFVSTYKDNWLGNTSSFFAYVTTKNSVLLDVLDSENKVRPIICINNNKKIKSGTGTKNNPYITED